MNEAHQYCLEFETPIHQYLFSCKDNGSTKNEVLALWVSGLTKWSQETREKLELSGEMLKLELATILEKHHGRRTRFRDAEILSVTNTDHWCATGKSFVHIREIKEETVAWLAGTPDAPTNIPPPKMWDMHLDPPPDFTNDEKRMTVPRTEVLSNCQTCGAEGIVRCPNNCTGGKVLWCLQRRSD